jgi:hypothetical protein
MDELPADTAGVALTGSLAAVQRGVDPGAGDLAVPLATYRPPARRQIQRTRARVRRTLEPREPLIY